MTRILIISYSQSGQLTEIVQSLISPLKGQKDIAITWRSIRPVHPFPFPWPIWRFFDIFPECIFMISPPIEPVVFGADEHFDLAVLAYQPWYFSPSLPIAAFLASSYANILKGLPVITLCTCKDTWLMAQEKVKKALASSGAHLIDHISFSAQGSRLASFIATPLWLWTGNRYNLPGILPAGGVSPFDIVHASRFGHAIQNAAQTGGFVENKSVLHGLGAVEIHPNMILFEAAVHRFFQFWAKIILSAGKSSRLRRTSILILFLLTFPVAALIALPMTFVMKYMFLPLIKKQMTAKIAYFEAPSGSATDRMAFFQNHYSSCKHG